MENPKDIVENFTENSKTANVVELFSEKSLLDKSKIQKRYIFNVVKRLIDIVVSSVGLIVLSPLLLFVSYKIRQEEPKSPVLFSQDRVGLNGKVFKMYKFRSMCIDAEEKLAELLDKNEIEGAMFKMKDDPRVTKIGKTIRAKSIDEIPQLWNVLKGDMSLIGPRPPLVREVAEYTPYDLQRLYVKPGCSGLWQVSGRNDVGFHEMVELDLKYIQSQSVINDFKIIFKTIWVVVKPNGAY